MTATGLKWQAPGGYPFCKKIPVSNGFFLYELARLSTATGNFPAAPILTSVTTKFAESNPEVTDFFSKMSFKTSTMSALLAWADENNASAEETAVHYLTTYQDEWSGWINDAAREKLAKLLDQG